MKQGTLCLRGLSFPQSEKRAFTQTHPSPLAAVGVARCLLGPSDVWDCALHVTESIPVKFSFCSNRRCGTNYKFDMVLQENNNANVNSLYVLNTLKDSRREEFFFHLKIYDITL